MRKKIAIAVVGLGLAAAAFVYLPRFFTFLRIGTTFAAQQTCACLHVSGRTLDACTAELGRAGRLLHFDIDGDTVRARALFGAFAGEARHESPFGCHPVK
jgi:hypothetical protein